jgi:hypothetical protein
MSNPDPTVLADLQAVSDAFGAMATATQDKASTAAADAAAATVLAQDQTAYTTAIATFQADFAKAYPSLTPMQAKSVTEKVLGGLRRAHLSHTLLSFPTPVGGWQALLAKLLADALAAFGFTG